MSVSIDKAKKDRVIAYDKKRNTVTYLPHTKTRSLGNPEEQVQLETFLSLVYDYGFPPERIEVCKMVKMGSATKEADIVVYEDEDRLSPWMIVECKKRGVSKKVFEGAVDQAFSYASATLSKYIWVTDGDRNTYYEVWPQSIQERKKNKLPDVPKNVGENNFFFLLKKWLYRQLGRPFGAVGSMFQSPLFFDTAIYTAMILLFMILFSHLTVKFFPVIQKYTMYFWKNHGMHFGWIFNLIAFISILLSIIISSKLDFLPRIKRGKHSFKTKLLLAGLLTFPVWFIGMEYRLAWWNWTHFDSMKMKEWIFIGPQLVATPIQMLFVSGMIWMSNRKRKGKK